MKDKLEKIKYSAAHVRDPISKKSDNWQETADRWIISINNQTFDYYTGSGHRKSAKPQEPTLESVLECFIIDADALDCDFEEWALNFGYDEDSRKALDVYLACQKNAKKLKKALPDMDFTELQNYLQQ